jgi:hypothetical protein
MDTPADCSGKRPHLTVTEAGFVLGFPDFLTGPDDDTLIQPSRIPL